MIFLAGVVTQYIWIAVDDLDDVSLRVQSEQIAHHVESRHGAVRLVLPEELQRAYRESGDGYLYAILDTSGTVLVASSNKAREFMTALPVEQLQPSQSYFRLLDSNGLETPYFALLTQVPGHDDLRIMVAQGYLHWDAYIESVLTEFAEHIGWTLPFILLAALVISIWTIRSSLRPIKALSAEALLIGPNTSDKRLQEAKVPDEVRPLISAVNSALDRLENGFQAQRRFTANAAHELRTPLAVLTARLSEFDDSEAVRKLSEDVARMNRLVSQLLHVSRLEAMTLHLDEEVDLNRIAAEVVGFLAPLAISAGRAIALTRSGLPVMVRASTMALEDALRNLIENALTHTPPDTEVTVTVGNDGTIAVRDHGPGVPPAWRHRIFEPFSRGHGAHRHGAGLGLAIVAETMRAHGGSVDVHDAPNGGAQFTIFLPVLPAKNPASVSPV